MVAHAHFDGDAAPWPALSDAGSAKRRRPSAGAHPTLSPLGPTPEDEEIEQLTRHETDSLDTMDMMRPFVDNVRLDSHQDFPANIESWTPARCFAPGQGRSLSTSGGTQGSRASGGSGSPSAPSRGSQRWSADVCSSITPRLDSRASGAATPRVDSRATPRLDSRATPVSRDGAGTPRLGGAAAMHLGHPPPATPRDQGGAATPRLGSHTVAFTRRTSIASEASSIGVGDTTAYLGRVRSQKEVLIHVYVTMVHSDRIVLKVHPRARVGPVPHREDENKCPFKRLWGLEEESKGVLLMGSSMESEPDAGSAPSRMSLPKPNHFPKFESKLLDILTPEEQRLLAEAKANPSSSASPRDRASKSLKELVEAATGVPVKDQKLVFNQRGPLDDHSRRLDEVGIVHGAQLRLTVKTGSLLHRAGVIPASSPNGGGGVARAAPTWSNSWSIGSRGRGSERFGGAGYSTFGPGEVRKLNMPTTRDVDHAQLVASGRSQSRAESMRQVQLAGRPQTLRIYAHHD
mmetsp:Transcript_15768/g.34608  ORF Transcript_15768/g.34608 Transcript_15768/m.34608 type:complete len:517 (-) Transcript_15768:104-1654(-)